jgi:acryloyl-coenzyme A reductase
LKCAQIEHTGWDSDLVLSDRPARDPVRTEIKVKVQACGVCYRDCIDRSGQFAFINPPVTPGHEAVGEVIALGPDATAFKIGDRVASMHRDYCGECKACCAGQTSLCLFAASVLGLLVDGGYAQEMVLPEKCFYPMDPDIPNNDAAILHCTFGTAYRGIARAGGLEPGARVLITGANGGVGHAAIQIAKRFGAFVIAVVRQEAHRPWLNALGADQVLIDTEGRFHKQISDPVDLVLECVGEPTFNASLRSVNVGGAVVLIGNVTPERAALNLGFVITRGIKIIGSSGATPSDMQNVLALYRDKPFEAFIQHEWPLDQADQAQRLIRAGGQKGRIVLKP